MARGVAPAQFPPPVEPAREFIGPPTDPEEERIEVGVAIVGGGPAGLACAIRLTQLLAEDEAMLESLGEVPIALVEKGKTTGSHLLSGAMMRPSAMQKLFPDLPESEWPTYGMVEKDSACVYDFKDNAVPGVTEREHAYWRDVGTIEAYHESHMDLVSIHPVFNLYNRQWPIYTSLPQLPPAKLVEGGRAFESLVSNGSIIAGGNVDHSVLAPDCSVHVGAQVDGSVLFTGVEIGRGAIIRRAIIDKNVVVPAGTRIGVDHQHDRERGFTVSAGGIVVVGKNETIVS